MLTRARGPHLRVGVGVAAALATLLSGLSGCAGAPQQTANPQATSTPSKVEANAQVSSSGATPATTLPPGQYVGMTAERTMEYIQAAQQHLNYLPGEVLVQFKDGVSVDGQQRALQALRSQPSVNDLRWAGSMAMLHDATQPDATVLAAQLMLQPEVAFAEPDYLIGKNLAVNDPGYAAHQWNFTALAMPQAWDINPGAKGIIVAVVDTGITTVNQSFATATWNGTAIVPTSAVYAVNTDLSASRLVSPFDFVTNMGAVVLDSDGHGTHVSSTIGEDTNNSLGEAGIAFGTKIMPVKVCTSYWDVQFSMSLNNIPGFAPADAGGCPSSAVTQGIRYAADNGAQVINVSLGGPGQSSSEQQALLYAVGKGAFISLAAGNEAQQGNAPEYPAAFASSIDGAMAVGATGMTNKRAYYSNTGSYIEIVAPGGDDQVSDALGSGWIWQSTLLPTDQDPSQVIFPRFDRYANVAYEGTSMAAPHVSGTAALLFSQIGAKATPAIVEALIKQTALNLGTANEYGSGLVQPRAALFGFGIVK